VTSDALDPVIHAPARLHIVVTLTNRGRAALDSYTAALRDLLGEL
jgi:hypothetical protein